MYVNHPKTKKKSSLFAQKLQFRWRYQNYNKDGGAHKCSFIVNLVTNQQKHAYERHEANIYTFHHVKKMVRE